MIIFMAASYQGQGATDRPIKFKDIPKPIF
jgi:hypothetical protein